MCWLLGVLFTSEFAAILVFKGGTSLSKVFGVIDRFSEDIDLSLAPEFLGLREAGQSRNQANKWMNRAEAACGKAVREQIAPALERAVEAVLGTRAGGWFEFLTDPNTNSPVLLFHYPSAQPAGLEYLKRAVKLEFGSLVPPDDRISELRRDYASMREMYLSEPRSFDEVLAVLAELEKRINGGG